VGGLSRLFAPGDQVVSEENQVPCRRGHARDLGPLLCIMNKVKRNFYTVFFLLLVPI
jgi:hypothetical protein